MLLVVLGYNSIMTIKPRHAFLIILGLIVILFLYLERAILSPFILAGIFAYIFNPVVSLLTRKLKLSRTLAVALLYVSIISVMVGSTLILADRLIDESSQLATYSQKVIKTTKEEIKNLPPSVQPLAKNTLTSLEHSKIFSSQEVFSLFPKAISRIVSLFIFLFSGFYFLKEGRSMVDKFLNLIPKTYKIDAEIIINRINKAFGGYLRGQLLLVLIVSIILYIALSILGVRFALILAIFSGFAEIVPYVGPVVAGGIATLVALITGNNNFALAPLQLGISVAIIYFVVRHFQDYFITPHVMGRIVKIHPLLIFFSVLAGGHLFGILGFILAVPTAASIKILLVYFFDKVNSQKEDNLALGSEG